jgi:uncharacterized protein DUF4236
MGFRFSRRVSLIPGLRLNASRSGLSLSVGHRGAWYTIGPRGRRVSLGLPGTGLYWTEHYPPARPPHAGHQSTFGIALIMLVLAAVFGLFHT